MVKEGILVHWLQKGRKGPSKIVAKKKIFFLFVLIFQITDPRSRHFYTPCFQLKNNKNKLNLKRAQVNSGKCISEVAVYSPTGICHCWICILEN